MQWSAVLALLSSKMLFGPGQCLISPFWPMALNVGRSPPPAIKLPAGNSSPEQQAR